MSSTVLASTSNKVVKSRWLTSNGYKGIGVPTGLWQRVEVNGVHPTVAIPQPALFNLADYAFPAFSTYGRPALKRVAWLDPLDSPYTDTVTNMSPGHLLRVKADGSWSNEDSIGSSWDWMGAQISWFTDAMAHGPQWQEKLKLTGAVRGTFVIYEALFNDPTLIYADDPLSTSMTPESAVYCDISKGEAITFEPLLPEREVGDLASDVRTRWSAFRYGKQPSDFPWYPL